MSGLYVEVDFRETELRQEKEILTELVESKYVEDYEVADLEVGDIIIDDIVCIERKTISDFVGSMQNGHLEDQIDRMYDQYDHVYLLVSGDMKDFGLMKHSKVNPNALLAFTASLAVRWQTPPIFCSTETLLAREAIDLGRKVQEPVKRTPIKPQLEVKNDLGQVGKVLMTVDGIGYETAKAIESEVWTVRELLDTDKETLQNVDGVGPKTAAKICGTIK